MKTPSSAPAITFIVRGQPQPMAGATRGGATSAASLSSFGGQGTLTQRVVVGAMRGSSDTVRVSARPGLDAVVLHISNGPSLMLHPETARDLMLAQSGLTRSTAAGRSRGQALPNDVNVPTQLSWQGLEQAGAATRGTARGRMGEVLLSAIEVVTGLLKEPAAKLTAAKIGARVDGQVDPGVYALRADAFSAPLKGRPKLDKIPLPDQPDAPVLVLLHGTFSNTQGTFGKLWQEHPHKVRELFARYGDRVYGLDHPTLLASPIENALLLARALPKGARLHLLTHSRGGLVAEVLARVCARPELDERPLTAFKDPAHRQQLKALRELAAELKGRDVRVERVVRVACPARGTLLASKRLDAYVSVLKWSLELANIPVAPLLIDFIGEVASQRTDPALLPGLEAMTPLSPLVQWLHESDGGAPLPGQLRVVAGDIQGDSIMSWVKTLLADAFYWTDNDLVVQTRSMYGGTPRAPAGGHAAATFVLERGGKVTHFAYFSHPRTAEAICSALIEDTPAGFRPIGPMSWAGSTSDGLRGRARAGTEAAAAERPAVILLPGILGSHLAVDGKRVWLSMRILGGLDKLGYQEGANNVQADGPIGMVYDALAEFLSATHQVIEFSFDWRRPIEEEAARLAGVIDQALSARATTGQPVRLIAHSMGGVVARTVQLERPDVWQRWLERPGSRLLMLGTPNGGSYAPMQVLTGDDTMGNALSSFGLPFRDQKARQLMAAMPGLIQLQAGLLDTAQGLAQSARWQALAEQDMQTLEQANFWHGEDSLRTIYQWGVPPQAVLDRAVALRQRLDRQRDEALAGFRDRVVMVVGRASSTPAGFEIDAREGLVYLNQPEGGDGRVTLSSALLPGVRAWKVDAPHGDLPDVAHAFEAYLDLLQHGDTQRLPLVTTVPATRGTGADTPAALARSRPSRQRNLLVEPPADAREVLGFADEAPAATAPAHTALRITVINANLKFVSHTVMVGHYVSSTLTGTEGVVDRFIGGVMSASLAAGLYPEATGTHQIFTNNRQDPDNPLALPRPPHVVVAGLGEEGKLRSAALSATVRQATLAWAQRVAETPGQGTAQFEMACTLIGSGGSGISVPTAAQAVAQGVREANEKLAAGGWPQVSHLRLVELYLDRATEAWSALRLLSQAAPEHFVLTPTVESGIGALRRPLDSGYRGTAYDFISAVTQTDDTGEPSIVYTLDTQRARAEVRAQATQAQLVGELVRRASNDANRDPQIGRTLFQLLVPVEMEASLGGTSELLLELDDGTAGIPWELLDAPNDGRGGPQAPWAIRNKLLRRLRTVAFRTQVSDARLEDAVLVIGEPLCDSALYPPLPSARAEAEAVRDALGEVLGGDRVHALIAPDDGCGPDAAAVTNALLARRYRIVHIAGHGEPELERPGKPPLLRGVVLSDGTFLGPREVQAMRVVPELVFLNCCHLAADPSKLLQEGYDRARFAAGVAKQLIRIGVRCVVAAGWAVEDDAANQFAVAFYKALLSGRRFMDAVQAARTAAYAASPGGNTWAAYQCYGDPEWVWQADEAEARRTPAPLAQVYAGIATPVALALALETLAIQSATQGAAPESQREKIRYLQARFEADWGGMGAVAEAFGVAFKAANDIEQALHWYRRAVAANDGSASVKASEQLANLTARQAWERVDRARRHHASAAQLQPLLAQSRADITAALGMLEALVTVAPTVERESLLGSACKRLAMLEGVASAHAARAQAAARMAEHYGHAEALAIQDGRSDAFYPALNLLAAELVAHGNDPHWPGPDAQRLRRVRESLEHKRRDDPDFWSVAGLPELGVYEALATRSLHQAAPTLLAAFEELHQRAGTPWMWASVADQLTFVLEQHEGGNGAHARAAAEVLQRLRGYGGLGTA
ncbi:CHAT domain-containing protein [Hydrogenophaga sp. BPS33]|uniref:CHAT domain-containing protein n=1 Tax=Hydrogenophaga sp. BPS33 TaxID=2651974 RepID=UPI00131F668F|nr:CHAT domain-containing protein [Hydrogenophaga sp. BPS33]QHE86692.1 CHAT domain-containing protein [Hydrogenophaga sp. BPS33]